MSFEVLNSLVPVFSDSSFVATAAVILICIVASWILLNPATRWKYRKIPGPVGWPVIGNLLEFAAKGAPALCQELEPRYGKVFKFWFGNEPHVVLSDPDVARRLSLRFNARPGFERLNVLPHSELMLAKQGLFSMTDMSLWGVARKAFDSSLLMPLSLAQYTPTMDSCALRLANRLTSIAASGNTVDMWRELGDMTLEVVGECAYGIDLHSVVDGREASDEQRRLGRDLVADCRTIFKQASIVEASMYVPLQLIMPSFLSPAIRWLANKFPDAKQIEALRVRKHIREVSTTLIEAWKVNRSKVVNDDDKTDTTAKQTAPTKTSAVKISDRSFLSALLAGRGAGATPAGKSARVLTDSEIVQQAFTFILAGYETTANTLAFTIYLLAVNPAAEERLLKEVDAFGRARPITNADLDQFPYTDAILKESLRLHTPLGTTMRTSTEELQVMGKTIPSGTILVFPAHTFHNSELYWPRPSEFLPERWLPEGQEKLGPTNPTAHMPFGLGARMCPGYKFAQLEAKISLVRIFQSFTFTLAPGMPSVPRTLTGITTGPADGVPVTVHSRK